MSFLTKINIGCPDRYEVDRGHCNNQYRNKLLAILKAPRLCMRIDRNLHGTNQCKTMDFLATAAAIAEHEHRRMWPANLRKLNRSFRMGCTSRCCTTCTAFVAWQMSQASKPNRPEPFETASPPTISISGTSVSDTPQHKRSEDTVCEGERRRRKQLQATQMIGLQW